MDETEVEWIKDIREKAAKLSLVDKSLVEVLLHVYCLDDEKREEIRGELTSLIEPFSDQLLLSRKPVLECPSKEEAQGEIVIGKVCQGENTLWSFGLDKEELNQHMLIVARSGHGKTVLIMNVISQLIENGIPFLAFDFKRDLRHLIRFYPIWVFRYNDLRINLLQPPPGVSLRRWEQLFCDLYAFNYGWFHGSRNMLQEYLHILYEKKGERATLNDLYELVKTSQEQTRKRQEYYDVVLNRLFSTVTNLGEMLDCRESMPIEELLKHPCVIELDQLARDEQNLIVEWFLFWIYAYRLAQGHRGSLRHVLIFDEAKRVFDANKEIRESASELGIAPIDLITDEIREFGEAIIASDQEPSKLTHSIKANTYAKICGFLGHGKDIDDMAEAMDLNEEERKVITKLERGEWLVKLAGKYTKPFMMKSEDFPVRKDVSDEELEARMKTILSKLLPKTEVRRVKPRTVNVRVSEDAWKLLLNINRNPFSGIVGRAKMLNFSGRRLNEAKKELIAKGLIEQVKLSLTGRRPTLFLTLTGKGLEFLRSKKVDTSLWRHVGNVGFEHMLYQVLIRWEFKKLGYDAHIEARLNDRRIDVLAVKDQRIGVEVELNPNVDLRHKLGLADKLDKLYIVTRKDLVKVFEDKLVSIPPKAELISINEFLRILRNLSSKRYGNKVISKNNLSFSFSKRNKNGKFGISKNKPEVM